MTRKFKITAKLYIMTLVLLSVILLVFMPDFTGKAQGTSVTACAAGDFSFEGTNILTGTLASIALLVVIHVSLKLFDRKDKRNRAKFIDLPYVGIFER
jgi:hypothetical protein